MDPEVIIARPAAVRFLPGHFAAYRRRAKWPFLWRISIEGLVVPIIVSAALSLFLHLPERTDLQNMGAWHLVISAVIVAPVLETLIFQSVPVAVARALGWGFWPQVVVSVFLFALAHFAIAASTGIAAGLFTGFYIAFTYVHWRETSFRAGLWMTAGVHALHNLALVGLVLAGRLVK